MNINTRWTRRQWFLILMIAMMHGLNHAFYVMITPLFLAIQKSFEFERLMPAMAIGSAFLLPYGIAHLPYGWLGDKVDKSRIIGVGGLGAGICLIIAGMLPLYGVVLAAVAVAGLCAATYHGVAAALITTVFPDSKGKGLGVAGIGSAVGLTTAPVFSGWIAQNYSWQASFVTFGVIGVVLSILFLCVVRESGKGGESDVRVVVGIQSKVCWVAMGLIMTLMAFRELCGWGSFSLVPTFAQMIHGYTKSQAGLVAACVTMAGVISGPYFGALSDRKGRASVLLPLLVFASISIMILPWLGAWMLPIGAVVFGFFYSATVPVVDAYIGDNVPDRLKGRMFGLAIAVGIGVGSFAPIVTASVVDMYGGNIQGFYVAFGLLSFCAALAILPLMLNRYLQRKSLSVVIKR